MCGVLYLVVLSVLIVSDIYGKIVFDTYGKIVSDEQRIKCMHSSEKPCVDAVLLFPCIWSKDLGVNYTLLSIIRFFPWIRRIHIQIESTGQSSNNLLENWKSFSNSRFVFFKQSLLRYSLTSPFLSEYFLICQPLTMVNNYGFYWQFFQEQTHFHRPPGVNGMTRKAMNECVFTAGYKDFTNTQVLNWCSQKYSKHMRDNTNYFIFKSDTSQITNEMFQPVRKSVVNNRSLPLKIVLCLVSGVLDDLYYTLPKEFEDTLHIWLYVLKKRSSFSKKQRISLIQRFVITDDIFIESYENESGNNDLEIIDNVAANIVKQLRTLAQGNDFKVLSVYGYQTSDSKFTSVLGDIGNKISQVYVKENTKSFLNTEIPTQISQETQRLLQL